MTERIPKSEWGPGPWQNEPDREEWRHAGLPCLIVRGPWGALCGYVGVPPEHPAHGIDGGTWAGSARIPVEVHGGLTYGAPCQVGGEICHVAREGEPEPFWLGFDCAHSGDLMPGMVALERREGLSSHRVTAAMWPVEYRDIAYVRAETNRLAEQLARPGFALLPAREEDDDV